MDSITQLLGLQLKRENRSSTQSYVPVKDIIDGIILTEDGRYVKVLKIEASNFEMLTHEEQDAILAQYLGWLKVAPANFQIKCTTSFAEVREYTKAAEQALRKEKSESLKALIKNYIDYLNQNAVSQAVVHNYYFIFEYESSDLFFSKTETKDIIDELNITARRISDFFSSIGNRVISSDAGRADYDTAQYLFDVNNWGTSNMHTFDDRVQRIVNDTCLVNNIDDASELTQTDIRSLVASQSLDFTRKDCVIQNGIYKTYLTIQAENGFPESISPDGWLADIINRGYGYDVDMFFNKISPEKIARKISAMHRIRGLQLGEKKEFSNDFEQAQGYYDGIRYLRACIKEYGEDIYNFTVIIGVYADSYGSLLQRKKALIEDCAAAGVVLNDCDMLQEEAHISAGSYNLISPRIFNLGRRNVPSSVIAASYPFTSYSLNDPEGVMLGYHKLNQSAVIYDNFDTKKYANQNIGIYGGSGRGKTFTLLTLTSRLRCLGIQSFILAPDKQDEFRRICDAVGGAFVDMSPSSTSRINVFDIWAIDSDANELINGQSEVQTSWMMDKITNLEIFFRYLIPEISQKDLALINQTLVTLYKKKGITKDNDSIYKDKQKKIKKEMPIMSELIDELKTVKGLDESVPIILGQFIEGNAQNLNGQTNIDVNNKYIVFGLEHLKGGIQAPIMYICLEYIWAVARSDKTKKKLIAIDEGWKLLDNKNPLVGDFVVEIFKIARGFGCAALFATQSLADLYKDGGSYGNAILSCSHSNIVLGMESKDISFIKDELGLSQKEITNILSYTKGAALLCAGQNHIPIQVVASEMEKELFTTDRRDLEQLAKKRKAGL